MTALKEVFCWNSDAEVTIEANPGTVDEEKLRNYLDCGINRISFGLQSADNEELRKLGRIHTWEEFLDSFHQARIAGFTNINVDLMSALPGQTVDSWRKTLEKVLELKPEHISAYSLIIEEGTPFYEKYEDHPELLPPEEEERQMYHDTKRILHEHGYERYEISNYARAGYACRHNLGYWERKEYKGFGLGSASLLENRRYTNTCELKQYLQGRLRGTEEELSEQDIREETFFLGLRKMEGIDPGPYRAHYEKLLEKLQMQQLLEEKNGKICLKQPMRHLIDPTDLTVAETEQIVALAEDIIANRAKYSEACKGRKLATLFYEPSTRTRLSFTSAMMELGGSVIGFSDANSSSVSKGETVADTVRVIRCFADIIAMRHFKEGAPLVASQYAGIPVINAGDGSHSHPTQTLTDLLTIKREKGRFDNMTIGFCGDLKFGRTVHSLIKALSRYSGIKVILIAPQELRLPDYMLAEMSENSKLEFREVETMEEVMPELDILYMTRVQKERFLDEEEFDRVKNSFVLDPGKLETAKEDMIILHPLPRVNEITRAVDNDPRAAYFRQVENGKFVRMALILTLLRWADENKPFEKTPVFSEDYVVNEMECSNRRCISATEDVDRLFHRLPDGSCRCAYCEAKAK